MAHLQGDGPPLVAKRMLDIVVPDEQVSKVVETIVATNKTGNRGDGRIFVMPITDTIRIRTREEGAAALA
jgi:nitrogen regulatory protein PII 2